MALNEELFPKRQFPAAASEPATRLKLAEQRYANLQKRHRLTEDALLDLDRSLRVDVKVLTQQSVELRRKVAEMNAKIDGMVGELSAVVQKHELAAVERYLDMWEPVGFVTREEAKRMIDEVKHA